MTVLPPGATLSKYICLNWLLKLGPRHPNAKSRGLSGRHPSQGLLFETAFTGSKVRHAWVLSMFIVMTHCLADLTQEDPGPSLCSWPPGYPLEFHGGNTTPASNFYIDAVICSLNLTFTVKHWTTSTTHKELWQELMKINLRNTEKVPKHTPFPHTVSNFLT